LASHVVRPQWVKLSLPLSPYRFARSATKPAEAAGGRIGAQARDRPGTPCCRLQLGSGAGPPAGRARPALPRFQTKPRPKRRFRYQQAAGQQQAGWSG